MKASSALPDPERAVLRAMNYAADPLRLQVVRRTGLLDAGLQESLQRYVRLASRLTGSPVAAVSVIDSARQYFAASHGIEVSETPLESSYCKHVVADDLQLAVDDTCLDAVLAVNPATSELGIRAYLGSPVLAGGQRIGALCVVDTEVHSWDASARGVIEDLAAAVSADIELRLRAAEQELMSMTDSLTGLGNRRALSLALERAFAVGETAYLGLLDLDGFKAYNDAFGHQAGDDLLMRLAERLSDALGTKGRAFRMGGDEFCVLVDHRSLLTQAHDALVDRGPGYGISSSMGSVELPTEAREAANAIGLADARLYNVKRSRSSSLDRQLSAALSVALSERDNELGGHSDDVAHLARATAMAMGLSTEKVRDVTSAARLHDIGKMAISDAVLQKKGPLNDEEWAVMKRHTIIGQRILSAAPTLLEAGWLVRSSHERWDGGGYPDGLAGEAIPLGARIINACDAFDAMTSDRPYRRAKSFEDALVELERCAGGQFDPRVVAALTVVLEEELGPEVAAAA